MPWVSTTTSPSFSPCFSADDPGNKRQTTEVGKRADITLATGSPLQATTQVTHVFIAGRPIELSNVHTEMYEQFDKRPSPTLPPLPELVGRPNLTSR